MSKNKVRVSAIFNLSESQTEEVIDDMARSLGKAIMAAVNMPVDTLSDGSIVYRVSIRYEDLEDHAV